MGRIQPNCPSEAATWPIAVWQQSMKTLGRMQIPPAGRSRVQLVPHRMLALPICLTLTITLAACGEDASPSSAVTAAQHSTATASPSTRSEDGDVDQEQWRADLADYGYFPADMDKLEEVQRRLCQDDQHELELFIAAATEDANLDAQRLGFQHVCPSRAADFDTARATVTSAESSVEEACAEEPALRTADEQELAEAMGC